MNKSLAAWAVAVLACAMIMPAWAQEFDDLEEIPDLPAEEEVISQAPPVPEETVEVVAEEPSEEVPALPPAVIGGEMAPDMGAAPDMGDETDGTPSVEEAVEGLEALEDALVEEPAEAGAAEADLIELEMEDEASAGVSVEEGETKDLITISLDDVPVQDVVRMFARISGVNIVAGTNLQGNVTVSLQEVEWEPALRVILDSVDMVMVEKTAGIYSIMSKDEMASEPVTVDTLFLSYTTVSNILPVIQKMLVSSNASASGFPAANAVVVQETANRLERIRDMVSKLDKPRAQVFIEAKFIELNDNAIKDLGINWQALEGYTVGVGELQWGVTENRDWVDQRVSTLTEFDRRGNVDTLNRILTPAGVPVEDLSLWEGAGLPAGSVGRSVVDTINRGREVELEVTDGFQKNVADVRTAVMSADEFSLTLSALKQNDGVQVVSNPKILVASGDTAEITVGTQEPNVRAVPQGDSGDRYAYELDGDEPFIKIGVALFVTPIVNTENSITVRIEPELSRKLADVPFDDGRITYPRTSSRKVMTEFNLENGRTVAIGGLTETRDEERVTKVPLLGDIPVLGKYLFRHTHTEKVQDEVIIFVTVSVAKPDELREESGIPSGGRLIHRHLTRKRLF